MSNFKFKRSTRSSQRGRGKNHSTNKERSFDARKRARIQKYNKEMRAKKRAAFLAIMRDYWTRPILD